MSRTKKCHGKKTLPSPVLSRCIWLCISPSPYLDGLGSWGSWIKEGPGEKLEGKILQKKTKQKTKTGKLNKTVKKLTIINIQKSCNNKKKTGQSQITKKV